MRENNHVQVKRLALVVLFISILAVAAWFRFSRLDAVEPTWDELMDTATVMSYMENPNPFDGHGNNTHLRSMQILQARLPYYIAVFTSFFVPKEAVSCSYYKALCPYIYCARIPSALFGVLTVLIVYFLGKRLYDARTGIISMLLLAISSYHIGFSRFAVTHGEGYDPFFYLLSLLLFFKGVTERAPKYLLFSGIAAGIACACKFSAVLLLPAFFLFMAVTFYRNRSLKIEDVDKNARCLLLLNFLVIYFFMLISVHWYKRELDTAASVKILFFFLAGISIYIYLLRSIIVKMGRLVEKKTMTVVFINMVLMSIIFTFIGSPIHLQPGNIIGSLKELSLFFCGLPGAPKGCFKNNPAEIIFFKLGIPFNLLFLCGFLYNLSHCQNRANLLISLAFLVYFIILSISKVLVSWYLMPILPLAIIIASRLLVLCWDAVKTGAVRIFLSVAVFAGISFQVRTLVEIAPYYHLDGYKWGDKFIGHNKPCFIFVDGIKDSVEWLEQNVPNGSRVGIIYYIKGFEAGRFDVILETMALLHSGNETIKYEYVSNKETLGGYDYLIVSALFGKEWVSKTAVFDLVYSIKLLEQDVYKIYEKRL